MVYYGFVWTTLCCQPEWLEIGIVRKFQWMSVITNWVKKNSHGTGSLDRSQKDGHCRTGVRYQLGLFHFAPTNRINSKHKSCVFIISEWHGVWKVPVTDSSFGLHFKDSHWPLKEGEQTELSSNFVLFNLLAPELFFLILAHPVYKMCIIQEPNTLELWNKLHFEEEKNRKYIPRLKYSVPIFVE